METFKIELDEVIRTARISARVILTRAAKSVLDSHPGLSHYVDAMGAQFFVTTEGKNLSYLELPNDIRSFFNDIAFPHAAMFGSLGWKVYRDRIITDW